MDAGQGALHGRESPRGQITECLIKILRLFKGNRERIRNINTICSKLQADEDTQAALTAARDGKVPPRERSVQTDRAGRAWCSCGGSWAGHGRDAWSWQGWEAWSSRARGVCSRTPDAKIESNPSTGPPHGRTLVAGLRARCAAMRRDAGRLLGGQGHPPEL